MTASIAPKQELTPNSAAVIIQRKWRGRKLQKLPLKPQHLGLEFVKDLLPHDSKSLASMICRVACLMPIQNEGIRHFVGQITFSASESKELDPYPPVKLPNPLIIEYDKINRQFFLHVVRRNHMLGDGSYKDVFASRSIRIKNSVKQYRHTVVSYLRSKEDAVLVQNGIQIERAAYADKTRLDSFNLPKFYSFPCEDKKYVITIQTRYESTLLDFIREKRCSNKQILQIFLLVLRNIKQIHKKGFIHNDIKPNNIMIDSKISKSLLVYLADWDIASNKVRYSEKQKNEYCFWSSSRELGYVTNTSDMYSFIMSLSQFFLGREFRSLLNSNSLDSLLTIDNQEKLLSEIFERKVHQYFNKRLEIEFPLDRKQLYRDLQPFSDHNTLESFFNNINLTFTAFSLLRTALHQDKILTEWINSRPSIKEDLNSIDPDVVNETVLEIEKRFPIAQTVEDYINKMLLICDQKLDPRSIR